MPVTKLIKRRKTPEENQEIRKLVLCLRITMDKQGYPCPGRTGFYVIPKYS